MHERISSGSGLGTLAACAESCGRGKGARDHGGAVPCACGMGPAEDSDARGGGGVALAWATAGRANTAEGEGENTAEFAVPAHCDVDNGVAIGGDIHVAMHHDADVESDVDAAAAAPPSGPAQR